MPAKRWEIDIEEIMDWVVNADKKFGEMVTGFQLQQTKEKEKTENGVSEEMNAENLQESDEFPKEIPILPLRGLVVFPQTAVPLNIGQPRSIRLVDEAVSDQRWIGLVTSRDDNKEDPDRVTL